MGLWVSVVSGFAHWAFRQPCLTTQDLVSFPHKSTLLVLGAVVGLFALFRGGFSMDPLNLLKSFLKSIHLVKATLPLPHNSSLTSRANWSCLVLFLPTRALIACVKVRLEETHLGSFICTGLTMAPSLVLVKGIRSLVGSNISCWGNAGFRFPSDLTSFINGSPRNAVPVFQRFGF